MVGSRRHVNGFFGVRRKRRMTINPAGVTIDPAGVTIDPALCIVKVTEKSEEKRKNNN